MANYLATSANLIVMPQMEVCQMIQRQGGHLTKATRRKLFGWGQNAFLNWLIIKAHNIAHDSRYPHRANQPTVVLVQPEAYTSKTCANCGNLNHRLGSSKHFDCLVCPYCTLIANQSCA